MQTRRNNAETDSILTFPANGKCQFNLPYHISTEGQTTTLRLNDDPQLHNAVMTQQIFEELRKHTDTLEIDLTGLTVLPSNAIALLVRLWQRNPHAALPVRNASPRLRNLLNILKLTEYNVLLVLDEDTVPSPNAEAIA